MKTFLLLGILILSLNGMAYTVQDTIVIQDLWQKKDTTTKDTFSTKLTGSDQEMEIIQTTTHTTSPKTKIKILSAKNGEEISINLENGEENEIKILSKNSYRYIGKNKYGNYRNFNGHWCGFNYGFVNFANTDYSDYTPEDDDFMDLDHAKSFVMQFNIFEQSINLVPRNNFGLVVGLGLEYQRLRFSNKNHTISLNEDKQVVPCPIDPDWKVKKNSFKTLYMTIPLLMEVQFPSKYNKRMYISAGIMGGVRLHSKTKIVYNNTNGNKKKEKNSDNFSMVPVKADAMARIGYKGLNVWGSYTLTRMFKSGKGPELHPYSIGLGITF